MIYSESLKIQIYFSKAESLEHIFLHVVKATVTHYVTKLNAVTEPDSRQKYFDLRNK